MAVHQHYQSQNKVGRSFYIGGPDPYLDLGHPKYGLGLRDGTVNVKTALENGLNDGPSAGANIWIPGGTYKVDSRMTLLADHRNVRVSKYAKFLMPDADGFLSVEASHLDWDGGYSEMTSQSGGDWDEITKDGNVFLSTLGGFDTRENVTIKRTYVHDIGGGVCYWSQRSLTFIHNRGLRCGMVNRTDGLEDEAGSNGFSAVWLNGCTDGFVWHNEYRDCGGPIVRVDYDNVNDAGGGHTICTNWAIGADALLDEDDHRLWMENGFYLVDARNSSCCHNHVRGALHEGIVVHGRYLQIDGNDIAGTPAHAAETTPRGLTIGPVGPISVINNMVDGEHLATLASINHSSASSEDLTFGGNTWKNGFIQFGEDTGSNEAIRPHFHDDKFVNATLVNGSSSLLSVTMRDVIVSDVQGDDVIIFALGCPGGGDMFFDIDGLRFEDCDVNVYISGFWYAREDPEDPESPIDPLSETRTATGIIKNVSWLRCSTSGDYAALMRIGDSVVRGATIKGGAIDAMFLRYSEDEKNVILDGLDILGASGVAALVVGTDTGMGAGAGDGWEFRSLNVPSGQVITALAVRPPVLTGIPPEIALNYAASTDLHDNADVAADTWFDVIANQSFSVKKAGSTVEIAVSGAMQLGNAGMTISIASRLVLDSSGSPQAQQLRKIGGALVTATGYGNPLAGSAPWKLTNLVLGTHTVKLQVLASDAAKLFLRAATAADSDFLTIQVTEHK